MHSQRGEADAQALQTTWILDRARGDTVFSKSQPTNLRILPNLEE
ncbi:hypothetical protein [Leptolyngbya sp. DQ-M1]